MGQQTPLAGVPASIDSRYRADEAALPRSGYYRDLYQHVWLDAQGKRNYQKDERADDE